MRPTAIRERKVYLVKKYTLWEPNALPCWKHGGIIGDELLQTTTRVWQVLRNPGVGSEDERITMFGSPVENGMVGVHESSKSAFGSDAGKISREDAA